MIWRSSSLKRCKNGNDWLRQRNHIHRLGPSKYSPHFTCTVVILSLYCGHQFCPVDTRYPSVIFPLFISSPCVARQVVVRRKSGSTEHQRSCNRRELISTGRQTHEVRIKRMSSAQPVGTFSVRRPFQLLCMLKTCHRIDPTSPDEERISPHVTRRQAYKQRMRTDTNGSKIGVYVSRPLVLSGKVWHPFYFQMQIFFCGHLVPATFYIILVVHFTLKLYFIIAAQIAQAAQHIWIA